MSAPPSAALPPRQKLHKCHTQTKDRPASLTSQPPKCALLPQALAAPSFNPWTMDSPPRPHLLLHLHATPAGRRRRRQPHLPRQLLGVLQRDDKVAPGGFSLACLGLVSCQSVKSGHVLCARRCRLARISPDQRGREGLASTAPRSAKCPAGSAPDVCVREGGRRALANERPMILVRGGEEAAQAQVVGGLAGRGRASLVSCRRRSPAVSKRRRNNAAEALGQTRQQGLLQRWAHGPRRPSAIAPLLQHSPPPPPSPRPTRSKKL